MNYPLFAILAMMFIAYVYLKASERKRKRKNDAAQEQRIRYLEEQLKRAKDD